MQKKALVTGSSRGIGAATARALAGSGWRVTINYIQSREKAEALAAELGTEAVRADVSDSAQVQAMFDAAGPFDLLVCNAGIAWSGLLTDMTDSEWRRIVDVNLGGAFNCCRAAIPHMVHEKRGCILCMSSILGVYGGSCETAYSATKGGIIAFVKGLAKELGPSGIRVNAIAPGFTRTPLTAKRLDTPDDPAVAKWLAGTPMGRVAQPEEMVCAVLYLASDMASFTTGACISVDGGYTCL